MKIDEYKLHKVAKCNKYMLNKYTLITCVPEKYLDLRDVSTAINRESITVLKIYMCNH